MTGNVVIVGAGASGLAAAVASARAGAEVTVLERGRQPGRKLLRTGNGRCNLTNVNIEPRGYNHPEFVAPVLDKYSYAEIHAFFESIGLMLAESDDEGRVYPYSRCAESVLEALLLECRHLGVKIMCGFDVVDVRPRAGKDPVSPFALLSQAGGWVSADKVILASGADFALVPFFGHTKIKGSPVLCPLATDTSRIKGLSGLRVRCTATLYDERGKMVAGERGELLFRDYGVSGIMVFDLSRVARPGWEISLDFFPDMSADNLARTISERKATLSWRRAEELLSGTLPPKLSDAVFECSKREGLPVEALLKDFRLKVRGVGDAQQAQATRGGVSTEEVDPLSMASLKADGLFIAGEALDVDGRCGGYNLHWAWASGLTAGVSAAR